MRMKDKEICFPPFCSLPIGHRVVWSEATEHYHAINDELDWESAVCFSRWQARLAAFAHARQIGERRRDE